MEGGEIDGGRFRVLCPRTSTLGAEGERRTHPSFRSREPIPGDPLQRTPYRSRCGGVGTAYDNAMAGTINGLYKTEDIRHRGPWKGLEEGEFTTLE
jgi:hypothetical protein